MVTNLTISELKKMVANLPDDIPVVIPVIDENNCNRIFGFRFVRTAGMLFCQDEEFQKVLCLNAAADEMNISEQVFISGRDVDDVEVLFGNSKHTINYKE